MISTKESITEDESDRREGLDLSSIHQTAGAVTPPAVATTVTAGSTSTKHPRLACGASKLPTQNVISGDLAPSDGGMTKEDEERKKEQECKRPSYWQSCRPLMKVAQQSLLTPTYLLPTSRAGLKHKAQQCPARWRSSGHRHQTLVILASCSRGWTKSHKQPVATPLTTVLSRWKTAACPRVARVRQ